MLLLRLKHGQNLGVRQRHKRNGKRKQEEGGARSLPLHQIRFSSLLALALLLLLLHRTIGLQGCAAMALHSIEKEDERERAREMLVKSQDRKHRTKSALSS